MWSWMSPRTRRVMIGPAPATTSAYPSRTSHFAGVPSCDRHCDRSLPSNSTMASDGGGGGGRSGPGSTTGGRGRSIEWTGQVWAVIVAGSITPMTMNAERETRNAEQKVAALFRVPTSAFRVSLKVSRFPSPLPARTVRYPPGESRASRSEEHTSELQSLTNLVCRLLLEKKKKKQSQQYLIN